MFIAIVWIIFLVVFGGTLWFVMSKNNEKKSNTQNIQKQLNDKAKESIYNSAFYATHIFYMIDFTSVGNENGKSKQMIAIDEKNKKICLIDYFKQKIYIMCFSDILDYEVYYNGNTITTGGMIGGLFGGIFGAQNDENCDELRLIIKTKMLEAPQITYDLISRDKIMFGVSKSSKPYRDCVISLQEVVSVLDIIKNDNKSSKENKE